MNLSYRAGVFRGGNAEFLLELAGEVVHGGILQCGSNFRKVQVVLPDHLLALLELDAADVFAGGNLQILLEQHRQIAGADIHLLGNQPNGELFPDVGGNILLGVADNFVFGVDGVGALELAAGGAYGFPEQNQQKHGQLRHDHVGNKGIPALLGAQHLLQQGDGLLRDGELPVIKAG